MPATFVLRALIITEVALSIALILTGFFPSETTPAVDEYLEGPGAGLVWRLLEADTTAINYMLGALLVVFVTAYVASLIGVFLLKSWGRRLYVVVFVVGVCSYSLFGSSLVDPVSAMVNYLAAACSGAILATLFSRDVKVAFDGRTSETSLERTHEIER